MAQSDQTYTAVHTGSQEQLPPHNKNITLSYPITPKAKLSASATEDNRTNVLALMYTNLGCKWKFQNQPTAQLVCIIKKYYWLKKQVQYGKKNICSQSVGNTSLLLMHRGNVIPTLHKNSQNFIPFAGKEVNNTLKWAAAPKNPRQNFQLDTTVTWDV